MFKTSTILNGASLGSAVDLGPAARIVGIVMPTAWDAASMTFVVSHDGVTYQILTDDGGTELTFTVSASKNIGLRRDQSEVLSRFRFVKPRSGTSGAAVNQTADRTVGFVASDIKV